LSDGGGLIDKRKVAIAKGRRHSGVIVVRCAWSLVMVSGVEILGLHFELWGFNKLKAEGLLLERILRELYKLRLDSAHSQWLITPFRIQGPLRTKDLLRREKE